MTTANRRTMGTQIRRRPNREETERIWEGSEQRQSEELPPGHGEIVRDAQDSPTVVNVKPPGAHVDADGNAISPHHRIDRAAPGHHLPAPAQRMLERSAAPAHQVGAPPPTQAARTVAGHADPRRTPQSEPQTAVYRIQASTTSPSGAQRVDTQHGGQSMAQRSSYQGGVVHVGGQSVQPIRSTGMPASVHAVPGEVSPAQAAQMLARGGHAPMGPAPQFQGGARAPGASVGVGGQHQPVSGRQAVPGAATVLQESSVATIAVANEEVMRRELEAAGQMDRMPKPRPPTTLPRRASGEELLPPPTLDVTVILSAFSRPALLKGQIDALRKGTKIPRNVIVLVGQGVPVADALVEGFPWAPKGSQIPHNTYGLPVTPWERFRVAARVPTKYVCVLDDDCIPGPLWLEACVDAMEGNLNCMIAAAGSRLSDSGEEMGYRGPAVDEGSQDVTWSDLGDESQAAVVDVGEMGWFFETQWAAFMGNMPPNEPPYGWQIHVSAALLDPEAPIRTVVLPYGNDRSRWGATLPAQQDGLSNLIPDMETLRDQEFSIYRDEGWPLILNLPEDRWMIPVPKPGDPPRGPALPKGAYFNKKLDRYVAPGEPEWSADVYESVTGETWVEPAPASAVASAEAIAEATSADEADITETPQPDTSSVRLGEGGEDGDADGEQEAGAPADATG